MTMKAHRPEIIQAWAKENGFRQFIRYEPNERRLKPKKDYGYRRKPNRPAR